MTLREAASSTSALLARKGSAVPARLNGMVGGLAAPRPLDIGAKPAVAEIPAAPAPAEDTESRAVDSQASKPVPAASLLSFELLKTRAGACDPSRVAKHVPKPTSAMSPTMSPAMSPATPSAGSHAAQTVPDEAEALRPDPTWRVGIETLPREDRTNPALARAALFVAFAGIVAIGWYAFDRAGNGTGEHAARIVTQRSEAQSEAGPSATSESPQPTIAEEPRDVAAAIEPPWSGAPAAAPAGEPDQGGSAVAGPDAQPALGEETQGAAEDPPPPATGAPAGDSVAARPADDIDAGGAAKEVSPSVDVVRIEPDGAAVIAGRAAPDSELIILDNGNPIGTATADAFGEWVFIPSSPLADGDHDFGLVIKSVLGGVTVPAKPKETPAAGGAAGGSAAEDPAADGALRDEGPEGAAGEELDDQAAFVPERKPVPPVIQSFRNGYEVPALAAGTPVRQAPLRSAR